jgi:hypothetical protein
MEWMQWLVPILSALLSGSGVWALFAARATARATQAAAQAQAAPAAHQAVTAEWNSLMTFWQSEMTSVRNNASKLEVRILFLEQQREDDLAYIEDLEQHIWKSLPPPPPVRKRRGKKDTEAP